MGFLWDGSWGRVIEKEMFDTVIYFRNGVSISEDAMEKTAEKVLQTIKSELPEEAQTYEVYEAILCRCKDRLQSGKIVL